MRILDCLLVSATIFYTNKAKIWMGVVTSYSDNWWHLFVSVTVAMLICMQWSIYLQWYVANIEVGTLQANGADCRPQYTPSCLESDCRPSECKKLPPTPSAPRPTRLRHSTLAASFTTSYIRHRYEANMRVSIFCALGLKILFTLPE